MVHKWVGMTHEIAGRLRVGFRQVVYSLQRKSLGLAQYSRTLKAHLDVESIQFLVHFFSYFITIIIIIIFRVFSSDGTQDDVGGSAACLSQP